MNREIKFRAWDKVKNKMLYVGMFKIRYEKDNGFCSGRFDKDGDYYEYVLMQYTGLKDKNGKEIYEGDVLTFGNSTTKYVVRWNNDGWLGISNDGDNYGPYTRRIHLNSPYHEQNSKINIFGNIHENPELLNS